MSNITQKNMERQRAKIISIQGNILTCTISCSDACQGCAARKVCSSDSSANQKNISLISYNKNHRIGDTITLEVSAQMGLKAVLLAYILPVVIILAMLLIMQSVGISELSSAIWALVALTLYFFSLKLFSWGKSISISVLEDTINE